MGSEFVNNKKRNFLNLARSSQPQLECEKNMEIWHICFVISRGSKVQKDLFVQLSTLDKYLFLVLEGFACWSIFDQPQITITSHLYPAPIHNTVIANAEILDSLTEWWCHVLRDSRN